MGLDMPKSLIEVRDGLTFLDFAALQVRALRERHNVAIPLLLMNSYSSDRESCAALDRYPDLHGDIPIRFLQHRFPKVRRDNFEPVAWRVDPRLEWHPPGHGEIYAALLASGVLTSLREHGVRYLFVSNSDNLGATLDLGILGHVAANDLAFAMEVAVRQESDRKGGHLARGTDGRLLLRESVQCPADDVEAFQDITRHRYFNTNNVWLNLDHLERTMAANGNVMPLPLIVNPKTVDPRDPISPEVYQLETALGAAISVFDRVAAIEVPRGRFIPVKRCADLLAASSDRYDVSAEHDFVLHPQAPPLLRIALDPAYFTHYDDFRARFPEGPPSLRHCTSLNVTGDVLFGGGVKCEQDVAVGNSGRGQKRVPGNTTLRGRVALD
jgi:UTP--glucose-1-phosphate uridylyltransferase